MHSLKFPLQSNGYRLIKNLASSRSQPVAKCTKSSRTSTVLLNYQARPQFLAGSQTANDFSGITDCFYFEPVVKQCLGSVNYIIMY